MATQEVVTRLPAYQEDFLKSIFDSAAAMRGVPMPYAPQQVAGLGQGQQMAMDRVMGGLGQYEPYLQQAAAMAGPGGAEQYMNPYTSQVVDQTLADIARSGNIQRTRQNAQAVGAGAFGGSRAAIADAELTRNVMDQQTRAAGALRNQGFQQAQQAAQRGAQLYGQLGQFAQQANVQDINTLLGIGSLEQGYTQSMLDAQRQNELAMQSQPYQQIGFMSDIFRGVPSMQQTYSNTVADKPSRSSQLLGLGIAGLGAYGQAMSGTGRFLPGFGGN